jgi:hypothetical protein
MAANQLYAGGVLMEPDIIDTDWNLVKSSAPGTVFAATSVDYAKRDSAGVQILFGRFQASVSHLRVRMLTLSVECFSSTNADASSFVRLHFLTSEWDATTLKYNNKPSLLGEYVQTKIYHANSGGGASTTRYQISKRLLITDELPYTGFAIEIASTTVDTATYAVSARPALFAEPLIYPKKYGSHQLYANL